MNFNKLIQIWGIIFLIGIGGSIVAIDIIDSYRDFHFRADQMRADYTARQKQIIKHEVERVVDMIRYEKSQSERIAKSEIKARIYEAYAIAQNIYQKNKNAKSKEEIQKLIRPKYDKLDEGPEVLKRLLRISGAAPEPEAKPKVYLDTSRSYINEDNAWVVRGTIRVPEDRLWKMEPTLKFAAETGSGKTVDWEIKPILNCTVDHKLIVIEPGIREAVFEGMSIVDTHPAPTRDSTVKVILRNVSKTD